MLDAADSRSDRRGDARCSDRVCCDPRDSVAAGLIHNGAQLDLAEPAALAAGVNVALGTDAGIIGHGTNLRELALLVEFGLTPMQAILAGTSGAAALCGIADEVGTIEPGKRADLVATALNPLTQIGALADAGAIQLVVQAGQVHLSTTETDAG
jgi:imidazolonepropionase-like amidohydrolase